MMETSPPVLCPWCFERTSRVAVLEKNGDMVVICFTCDFPIRVAR